MFGIMRHKNILHNLATIYPQGATVNIPISGFGNIDINDSAETLKKVQCFKHQMTKSIAPNKFFFTFGKPNAREINDLILDSLRLGANTELMLQFTFDSSVVAPEVQSVVVSYANTGLDNAQQVMKVDRVPYLNTETVTVNSTGTFKYILPIRADNVRLFGVYFWGEQSFEIEEMKLYRGSELLTEIDSKTQLDEYYQRLDYTPFTINSNPVWAINYNLFNFSNWIGILSSQQGQDLRYELDIKNVGGGYLKVLKDTRAFLG